MARRTAPVPRMVDLEALLLRDYELHGRRSRQRAAAAFAHLRAHLTEIPVSRAFSVSLDYALARRAEGAASATVRYEISMLGRALTLAVHHGRIQASPVLARPTVQNTRQGFVSAEDLRTLLKHLEQPLHDAAVFAYVTGWRREEVFGLTWDRVDMRAQTVRLEPENTKNATARLLPYGAHPWLRAVLRRRRAVTLGPYVFHRDGERVRDFWRKWNKACLASGVGHTLFQDFRRSAVRNMERAGVPRSVAMALTGHKTESIYRRYAITNEADLGRGVRLIAKLSTRTKRDEEERDDSLRNGS